MDSDQRDVLDTSQIEDLRGIDDGAMFAKLVAMYVAKTPERLAMLRTHLEAKNFAAIVRDAHTIKGASGSIGAARVAHTCARIDQAGKAQDAKALEELVRILEREFAHAHDALKATLGSA